MEKTMKMKTRVVIWIVGMLVLMAAWAIGEWYFTPTVVTPAGIAQVNGGDEEWVALQVVHAGRETFYLAGIILMAGWTVLLAVRPVIGGLRKLVENINKDAG